MATVLILAVLGSCTPRGPAVEILYTANLEGSFLDLPCNQMGPAGVLFTIPPVMEEAGKLRQEIAREGVRPILVDGGNTFLGIDDFSAFTGGRAVMDMMDRAGYAVISPGRLEFHHSHRLTHESIRGVFLGTNIENQDAQPGFVRDRVIDRGPVGVAFFSYYEPYRSPLGGDETEHLDSYDFDLSMNDLNRALEKSPAGIKIVLCRVNDLDSFTREIKGADLVIPGRFHPGLISDKVTELNGVDVAPYVNSRVHGVARFSLTRGKGGRIRVGVTFHTPRGDNGIPDFLQGEYKAFQERYGNDYSRFHSAILGVGDSRLTHEPAPIRETPASMLICDIIRGFARTDLAIINLLSVRKGLDGIIRGEYVEWVMPFGNRLVTMELTGQQVTSLMQVNHKRRSSFLVISGAELKYSPEGVQVSIDGKPLENDRRYTIATNDYLAGGEKLDYRIFRLGDNVRRTGIPLNSIFLSHLSACGYLDLPPRRIGSITPEDIGQIEDPHEAVRVAYERGFFHLLSSMEGGDDYLKMARRYAGLDLTPSLAGLDDGERLLMKGLMLFRRGEFGQACRRWLEAPGKAEESINLRRLLDLAGNVPHPGAGVPLWPGFKGDFQNTGHSPYQGPAKMPHVAWKFETHHSNKSSPAISADGTIFFGGGDGYFYGVSPQGELLWKYQAGEYILSSPAIASDGTIYFGSAPRGGIPRRQTFGDKDRQDTSSIGYVFALNPDGTMKWRYLTGGWVASSPAITGNGSVVVGSNDHHLHCINPDGTLRWKFKTGGKILSSPAVAPDGTIYVGSEDFNFYALDEEGKLKWKFTGENKFFSSPAIDSQGRVYIGNDDSHLYVFNPDGTVAWKKKFPAPVTSTPTPLPRGGLVVGCEDGRLYRLDSEGRELWNFKGEEEFFSSPIVDPQGRIYIGCEDNFLYCVSPSGGLLWKFETGDYVESTVSIAPDGTLYLCGEDKYLYALRERKDSDGAR